MITSEQLALWHKNPPHPRSILKALLDAYEQDPLAYEQTILRQLADIDLPVFSFLSVDDLQQHHHLLPPKTAKHLSVQVDVHRLPRSAEEREALRKTRSPQTWAHTPIAQGLQRLSMTSVSVTDEDVIALTSSPHLKDLTHLSLHGNFIGERGARALGEASNMPKLRCLDLSCNSLTHEAIIALTDGDPIYPLHTLHLANNDITNKSIEHFVKWPRLRTVEILYLQRNCLNNKSANFLAGSPYLKQLRCLHVQLNEIETFGVYAMEQAWPDAVLHTAGNPCDLVEW